MKNTHLEHLEDDILNSGTAGGFNVVSFLRSFGDMLSGKSSDVSITTKWDGAPAIICGTDPVTGKFFAGTKSVFNKVTPKVCYDATDVERFYGDSTLAQKLKVCLQYLPQLNIKGIIQGDLLFTAGDQRTGIIGGRRVTTFTPNTITYAVPADSSQGAQVRRAKIGIVFHTVYQGSSLQDCQAVFSKKAPVFDSTADIFVADANFNNSSVRRLYSAAELARFNAYINRAEGSLKRCSAFLDVLNQHGVMNVMLKRFFNQRIRGRVRLTNVKALVQDFANYYAKSLDQEKMKKKTAATQSKYEQTKIDGLKFIVRHETEMYFVIASYLSIRDAKKMVIKQLNQSGSIMTFIDNIPTTPEGYVVCKDNSALKFVDDEFRFANITVDKSWGSK